MAESYKKSRTRYLFSHGTTVIDMTDEINGTVVKRGEVDAPRFKRQATDEQGVTADGVACGLQFTFPLYRGTQSKAIKAQPRGNLMVIRDDANYVYALPVTVSGSPGNSTFMGANTETITMMQGAGHLIAGTKQSPGSVTVASGEAGYSYGPNAGIVAQNSTFTVPANGVGVKGLPWLAERIA